MLRVLKTGSLLLFLVALIYVLDRPWGMVPAIGKLFSPFHGYLQNVERPIHFRQGVLELEGLYGQVAVHYDDQRVAHIFAENDHDLYLAQGYVVAKDRLWQMEFYGLAAAGRLSEIVGPAALELDRYHRRLGMAHTAQEIVRYLNESDSLSMAILEAYTQGVNAYIHSLDARQLPLEYKILGYRPESWSPYKSILMLMNMRHDLSTGTDDFRMSNVLAQIGATATSDLFPDYPSLESPIIPAGTVWDFVPVAVPPVPDTVARLLAETDSVSSALSMSMTMPPPTPEIGSNNWAISGSRSATGLPLLANDPHLSLSLPSIWYQIQLHAPGVNVYGVALPGTPAVIIGFNKDVAWGVTNIGSDVLYFYRIRFRDESRQAYWHDGVWKATRMQIEVFHQKGAEDYVDTVYYTHHGPVIYHEEHADAVVEFPVGHALRWAGHETQSSDLLTFHYLNRAANYEDYRGALSYFAAPAQNFVFADNKDNVAITSNGRLPLKWHGQGKFLMDGSLSGNDWQGWIPRDHNPQVRNPDQGFVSSANQFPADPTYPYYLGWQFASSSRALRINERLAAMDSATVDDFIDLLHDNYNMDARRILPTLLEDLRQDATISALPAYRLLADWDYLNDAESVGASIFERWIPRLSAGIWKDEFDDSGPIRFPSLDRTYKLLLEEPDSEWFDDKTTPDQLETREEIVQFTFLETIASLEERFGPLVDKPSENGHLAWARVKNTTIAHLVPNFTPFSRFGIANGGGARIVNATSHSHGPSWRMIVQLDRDWPQAWGIFPGGQSGNPGSRYYDNMIDNWAAGTLNELVFLRDVSEAQEASARALVLRPSKK